MKKVLCSFGDKRYSKSLDLLEKSAKEVGNVQHFVRYMKEDLMTERFWIRNSFILNRPRGAGYWIWKPYIILKTMENLDYGDIVMYSDAAVEVIEDLTPLFDMCPKVNNGKLFFRLAGHHKNRTWTKRDTFVLMGLDEPKYWDAYQTSASYHLWIKSDENIAYLKEYQKYLKDPRIVTDDINLAGKANHLEFEDHRHDQSVLTILATKYNFELFRDPTQYGNKELELFNNSPYEQLFHHHRNFKHLA